MIYYPLSIVRLLLRIRIFTLISIIILLISCGYFEKSNDINGWREAKWGMTEEEIVKAFKGEAAQNEKEIIYSAEEYSNIGIRNFELGPGKYNAHFIMDKSTKKLVRIQIAPPNYYAPGGPAQYRYLETLLMDKYGPAQSKVDDPQRLRSRWVYPSTIIQLWCSQAGSLYTLGINYEQNTKKNLDKI